MALPSPSLRSVFRWLLPAMWVVVAAVVGQTLTEAVEGRSTAVRTLVIVASWMVWTVAAVAMVIMSTVSLTLTRVLVPASLAAVAVAAASGSSTTTTVIAALAAAVATALCLTPEIGVEMVQASAYGDEVRVPLRAPVGFLIAAVLAWLVWIGLVIAGPLALAAGQYAIGIPLTVLAVAATALLPRRWHQLATRWLVFVPAGVVVHDHVVLAETLMVRRHELGGLGLALSTTEAMDLTGPAGGHVLELTITTPTNIHLARAPSGEESADVVATRVLVAPSRPGFALGEAARRRFPVGRRSAGDAAAEDDTV